MKARQIVYETNGIYGEFPVTIRYPLTRMQENIKFNVVTHAFHGHSMADFEWSLMEA